MRDGLVPYDFPTGKFHGHSEEVVPAKMLARDVGGIPTTVTLEAVTVSFCADGSCVDLATIWQDYDEYRR